MPFTGTPIVKRVSDSLIRITGISLDASAVGTISLADGAGEIKTPIDFQPTIYAGQGPGGKVTLQDSIELSHLPCVPIQIDKTGTVKTDWLATLTNIYAAVAGGASAQSAMFYGITGEQSPDYPVPVQPGDPVPFPRLGPVVGTGIVPGGVNQFVLPVDGVYRVSWSVNFTAASQLQVALDGFGIDSTLAMASEPVVEDNIADQINNTVLVSATAKQLLSIINPSGNAALNVADANNELTHEQAPSLTIELVQDLGPASTGPLEIYIRHH